MSAQIPSSPGSSGLDVMLQNARKRAGLTQEQLAGLSTVSVRAIRDLEQGRVQHPRKETLRLLAGAMRLSDARRAELELAVDSAQVGVVFRDAYSAELAAPPTPLRPLTGRRQELRALVGLLGAEHERLLTVVGLPGVGKSRLAQEAALLIHAQERIPVLWVAMDEEGQDGRDGRPALPVDHSPQSAMAGWIRALVRHGEKFDELATVIGDKPTLVVLDGHRAVPTVGPHLMKLLHSCERLKILITTCRTDRVPGGRLLPLSPLPVPGAAPAARGESLVADRPAVELMLSYVGHMRPDLLPTDSVTGTVAQICRALDGIPLALEAAASWLLVYSPEQLLEIATRTPLALIDGVTPQEPSSSETLGQQLASVITSVPPRPAALLTAMAARERPWTVDCATHATGVPLADTARDVHTLLLRGLIRQHPGGRGGRVEFTVLRLVRELVGQQAAPGARRTGRTGDPATGTGEHAVMVGAG